MNKLAQETKVLFQSVKRNIEYIGQFFMYVVTLGHFPFPRAKASGALSPLTQSTGVGKTCTIPIKKDEIVLLNFLTPDQKFNFEQSSQFKEYKKNPFNPINPFYQEFRAKSFIEANHPDEDNGFFQSPEYKIYKNESPLNPFSPDIQDVYSVYESKLKEKNLAKDLAKFEVDLERFFLSISESEKPLAVSFRGSKTFADLLATMKASSNYAISMVKDAYERYKAAAEHSANDLQIKAQDELNTFISDLKKKPFFEQFSKICRVPKSCLESF